MKKGTKLDKRQKAHPYNAVGYGDAGYFRHPELASLPAHFNLVAPAHLNEFEQK